MLVADVTCGQIINKRHSSDAFITGAGADVESKGKADIIWQEFVKYVSAIRAEVKNNNSHKYKMSQGSLQCGRCAFMADVTPQRLNHYHYSRHASNNNRY